MNTKDYINIKRILSIVTPENGYIDLSAAQKELLKLTNEVKISDTFRYLEWKEKVCFKRLNFNQIVFTSILPRGVSFEEVEHTKTPFNILPQSYLLDCNIFLENILLSHSFLNSLSRDNYIKILDSIDCENEYLVKIIKRNLEQYYVKNEDGNFELLRLLLIYENQIHLQKDQGIALLNEVHKLLKQCSSNNYILNSNVNSQMFLLMDSIKTLLEKGDEDA